ncbi:unnamed protein product [Blepharisma stoltei]|uniref:Uncharacterized protein n=1 Tax=Blepharisma stoltei TaxID=1481888 RepID=A0AAU9JDT5_9CILI|nr:unnamed protein product [Blepharisma stoltei]
MIKADKHQNLVPAYDLVNGIKNKWLKAGHFDNTKIKAAWKNKGKNQRRISDSELLHKENFELDSDQCIDYLASLKMNRRTLSSTSFLILNIPQKISKRSTIKNILNFPDINPNKSITLPMIVQRIDKSKSRSVSFLKLKLLPKLKQKNIISEPLSNFGSRPDSIKSYTTEDEERFWPKAKYSHNTE